MKVDRRLLVAGLAPGLGLAVWLLAGGALFWLTLDLSERQSLAAAFGPILESRGLLPVLWWLLGAALAGWAMRRLYESHVAAPARLAEAAEVLVADRAASDLGLRGGASLQRLAGAVNGLAHQRRVLNEEMARQVREASRGVAQERNRLAALMAELTQSVVVCNLDGRILLYNSSARTLFRTLPSTSHAIGGADLIGLGRSIYTIFDRPVVAHALETIDRQRARRTADEASPSAQFVTSTPSGRLLRVQMAPVHEVSAEAGLSSPRDTRRDDALNGFVLMLEDISEQFDEQSRRDRQLMTLTEGSRSSLASIRAALEMLDYPDLEAGVRERFQRVVQDEVATMSDRLDTLTQAGSQDLAIRWPLQDMLGADLVSAVARRIESTLGKTVDTGEVDDSLWLKVDSFSLMQALVFLANCLVEEFGLRALQLRLARAGHRAHLDLLWTGHPASTETVMAWQLGPMQLGEQRSPLSVREVVERHGGEIWLERERASHSAFFRLLLPLTADPGASGSSEGPEAAAASPSGGSRPEFYDFDLFRTTDSERELEDRALDQLVYTVFDTETTGLDPGGGDRILQIGATRIVNGKLLRGECFDQLVDPERAIPEASIPIHGISQQRVRGQPTIEQVLPAFHAFARDTVLVGHNVAFDMRFLQLAEAASGVRFEQPVLDTLLLSQVVHPNQDSHRLEAIAERLGVTMVGRHTAIGDALVTAEVFLKLLALLRQQGIITLGQAREAAEKSYYARVRY